MVRFRAAKDVLAHEMTAITRDIHEIGEDDLKRYGSIVIAERDRLRAKGLQDDTVIVTLVHIARSGRDYVIEILDSTRQDGLKPKLSFVVYEGMTRKRVLGMLDVDGFSCVLDPELV